MQYGVNSKRASSQDNTNGTILYLIPFVADSIGLITTYRRSNVKITIAKVEAYTGNILMLKKNMHDGLFHPT